MGKETRKLSDEDMSKVTGGYIETFGFAKGSDVICPNPNCRASEKTDFTVFLNLEKGMNDCTCNKCGRKFSLDG